MSTPIEQTQHALDNLAFLETAALDEHGKGGFTPDEIQEQVNVVRALLEKIHAPLLAQQSAQKPLTAYKVREYVQVFHLASGDWIDGYVSSIDQVSRHLHVETEKGPVTVGTTRRVRPQQ